MSRTRGYFTAAGVALALGLAACSGSDADPEPAPPPTSSSPSPADGPAAPTMPPAARGTDAASAEAFVRFYWETVNHAQETGDVGALTELSRKCVGCDAAVKFIEDAYADGGRIIGGAGRPGSYRTVFVRMQGANWASVQYRLRTDAQVVDRAGSGEDADYPGGSTDVRMYLEPARGSWLVRSLVTL